MAVNIQIFLSIICVVAAEGHILDPSKPYFNHQHPSLHHFKDPKDPSDDRPVNGDVFSYNTQHAYNHFYHDGDYNPGMNMYPYFGYPGPFGMGNFDNMPFGMPSIHNEFNIPGHGRPNYINNIGNHKNSAERLENKENSYYEENPSNEKHEKEQPDQKDEHKTSVTSQKLEDMPPKTNKVVTDNSNDKKDKDDKVNLNANKDYLLVGNDGNGVYLLHENTPNINTVAVPNNNPQIGNNVVYVPYNPQQPATPVYQVVSGQPVASNVPLAPNRLDVNGYKNVVAPAQSTSNSNDPSYVLIYANGQLIQIPGVVINPSQNNAPLLNTNQVMNAAVNTNVPSPNYVYANPQNQGNNPMVVQVPNVAPVTNSIPNTGIFVQNPQIPNNNIVYGVSNPSNSLPQPTAAQPTTMGNVYVPANNNMMPNVGNQGSIVNNNPNPAGSVNNQGVQPALALPVNNNQNIYQPLPAQEKEGNGASTTNNAPAVNDQPANQQPPVAEQPNVNGIDLTNALGAQPAIMVSGFKENDNGQNGKKQGKKQKKEKTNKDSKKK